MKKKASSGVCSPGLQRCECPKKAMLGLATGQLLIEMRHYNPLRPSRFCHVICYPVSRDIL